MLYLGFNTVWGGRGCQCRFNILTLCMSILVVFWFAHPQDVCGGEGDGSANVGESEVSGRVFPMRSQDSTQCCLPA